MPVKWTAMSGIFHDVKVAIDKYVAQLYMFDSALSRLNVIHEDIMRKENSLRRRSLEVLIQRILKHIKFSLRKLPNGTHFVVESSTGATYINEKFTLEAKTLYPIMAALVIKFKKAKEFLEANYINTSLYTPFAEVPSRYKIKATDGENWRGFEEVVNKMGQEPRPTSMTEGKEESLDSGGDMKQVNIAGGGGYMARKSNLSELLDALHALI
jgi:hypothetical protein